MLTIIGCGNAARSDDGIGYHAIRALADSGVGDGDEVRLFDAATDGMAVMFQARGSSELVIVDACVSGGEPGAIYRLPGEELEQPAERDVDLHAFRWDHALYAGRRILGAEFPSEVTVYLVEAQNLAMGLELSSPVAAALPRLVSELTTAIEEHGCAGSLV